MVIPLGDEIRWLPRPSSSVLHLTPMRPDLSRRVTLSTISPEARTVQAIHPPQPTHSPEASSFRRRDPLQRVHVPLHNARRNLRTSRVQGPHHAIPQNTNRHGAHLHYHIKDQGAAIGR